MQWFAGRIAILAKRHQHIVAQNDLEEALGFLLQSGAPPALGFAKLDATFLALLGGELRHEISF